MSLYTLSLEAETRRERENRDREGDRKPERKKVKIERLDRKK